MALHKDVAFAFQFVMILNLCDIMNLMRYYEGGEFSLEKIEFGLDVADFPQFGPFPRFHQF